MNDSGSASRVFTAAALVAAVLSFFLLAGSWDGLYDALDLPQALPALTTQLGGIALAALAYLLWSVAATAGLARPAAIAGVICHGGGAAIVAAWLIVRDPASDLEIDTLGTVILISVAAVLALLAFALGRVALASGRRPE